MKSTNFFLLTILLLCTSTHASAAILGQHHFSWWDDPVLGVLIAPLGGPPPTANAIQLFDLDEWHLDQAQTTQWYNGQAVVGLPINPFNAANRNGIIGAIAGIANSEAFIYQITNLNYFNGNGPFTFTSPAPPGPGTNDLSGINIVDTGGALAIALPVPGSQFMFSSNLVVGTILDLTPGSAGVAASQDWDFNAFTGPGNFEWDIDTEGVGASAALQPIVFGFAMPGTWLDGVNRGHVHSWSAPGPNNVPPPLQVNIAGPQFGFSGPIIPEPSTLSMTNGALIVGAVFRSRRNRHGFSSAAAMAPGAI